MARIVEILLRRFPALTVAGFCVLWSAMPWAELVDDIDTARIPVADRSQASLASARSAGLRQVVIKMSGDRDSAGHPRVAAALEQPQRFLVQYSYEEDRDALLLRLEYDGAALRTLLSEAGQPLWTANRPRILAWLVYDDGDQRVFATDSSGTGLREAMKASFFQRGVPLQQPLYDLADDAEISPGAAWRQSSPELVGASQRYGDVEILAGRVARLSNGSWLGDWKFLDNGRWVSRAVNVASMEAFVEEGADLVAVTLAGRYAVVGGDGGDLRYQVSIEGVDSYRTFVAVRDLIAGMEAVQRVQPEALQGDVLVLRLESAADLAQLARIIELDQRLVREQLIASDGALVYRWEN